MDSDGPKLTREESQQVKAFFSTFAGEKILQTLDLMAGERNNLLQTVNSMPENSDSNSVGFKCSLNAAEARALLGVVEFLKSIGTDHVS